MGRDNANKWCSILLQAMKCNLLCQIWTPAVSAPSCVTYQMGGVKFDEVMSSTLTLVGILDKHAPVITREVPVRPAMPWYTGELRQLKQARGKAERKQSVSPAYRRARNLYSVNLNRARRHSTTPSEFRNVRVTRESYSV